MQIVNESLKRLHTDWFQLYNILEKETTDIGNISFSLPLQFCQVLKEREGRMTRWSTGDFVSSETIL